MLCAWGPGRDVYGVDSGGPMVSTGRRVIMAVTSGLLSATVERKERELECLVCLEVAAPPILGCQELHLICCKCQPKQSRCV